MLSFFSSLLEKRRKQRQMEKKGLIGSRKLRKKDETLSGAADRSKTLGILILILTWASCISVLVLPRSFNLSFPNSEGSIAKQTIISHYDFDYVDEYKTEELKAKARKSVPEYYRLRSSLHSLNMSKIELAQDEINARLQNEKQNKPFVMDPEDPYSSFAGKLAVNELKAYGNFFNNSQRLNKFKIAVDEVLSKGIIKEVDKGSHLISQVVKIRLGKDRESKPLLIKNINTVKEAAEEVASKVSSEYAPENRAEFHTAFYKLCEELILSDNLVKDQEATDAKKAEAELAIGNYISVVKKGETIVNKNQNITAGIQKKLEAYKKKYERESNRTNFWNKLVSSSVICLMLMILTGIFIYKVHPEIARSSQKMWIIGTAVILSMYLNYFAVQFFNTIAPVWDLPFDMVLQFVPIAFIALLLSTLIGFRIAVACGLFVAVVAGLLLDRSFDMLITGLFVSSVSAVYVRDSNNYRSFFFKAFFAIFLTMLLTNLPSVWGGDGVSHADFANVTLNSTGKPRIMLATLIISSVNALMTSIIALIMLFIYEGLFKVSTNMSLLLACDFSHPLLRRLQLEAPGTYHHSQMVASLAERAAEDIGASPIKARACALFHDIGKLSKPEYFTENNQEGNKHAELHPRMSSLVILNHVKEGVDLAIKHKLRKIIIDAIEQHHGTDLVYFFYKRAQEESKDSPVEEQEYRYPGPPPREKEVVIVSLADSCEAAARSIGKPTPQKIDNIVWDIFKKRIYDGQLNKAEITMDELFKIRKSFASTLTTMLHARIEYPKDERIEDNESNDFMAKKKVPETKPETDEKPDKESSNT